MSQTSRERRQFPVPLRWLQAGNDPSHPNHRGRRTLSSLISSQRLHRRLSHAYDLIRVQIHRSHSAGITSNPDLGAGIKYP